MKTVYITITILMVVICLLSFFSFSFNETTIYVKNKPLPIHGGNLYEYYRNLERPPTEDYTVYIMNPYDDWYLNTRFQSMNTNEIITFVKNIPYISETVEYPKYPIETLTENNGDCEDKSILLCSILSLRGYNVSLVRFKNHMSTLINNTLTDDYNLKDAITIYPVVPHPVFVLKWDGIIYQLWNNYRADINISIYNYGNIGGQTTLHINDTIKPQTYTFYINPFTEKNIQISTKVKSDNVTCNI